MGAEDITEVCWFYIVTARRRIGWVGDIFRSDQPCCFPLRRIRGEALGWRFLPIAGSRFWGSGSKHFCRFQSGVAYSPGFYKCSRWALFCRFRVSLL